MISAPDVGRDWRNVLSTLHELHSVGGQSPWIDDLRRSYVTAGGLEDLIGKGVRGLTSNPTIMTKAIESGGEYDTQFSSLIKAGSSVEDAYWDLVLFDAEGALKIFRPLYDSSDGNDGFVSVEVSPKLAHDTKGTIEAARWLSNRVNAPNLLVKIPATKEGLPAIEQMISEGRSVNVTLIFSLDRYDAVISAYMTGLERLVANGGDPHKVASVASFFVSRVDTEIDKRLQAIADGEPNSDRAAKALGLCGKAAISQGRLAYALFAERFTGSQFDGLRDAGAKVQRPLWASTSTKNPAYPDLMYVEGLIGPDTVNTMPAATVEAFLDHGKVHRTIDDGFAEDENRELSAVVREARSNLDALGELGISLHEVTDQLETEGVTSFAQSFDDLITELKAKARSVQA